MAAKDSKGETLSLKKLSDRLEALEEEASKLRAHNAALETQLEDAAGVVDLASKAEDLSRQAQEQPGDSTILEALKEIMGQLGERGFYRRSLQGWKVTQPYTRENYNILQEAALLASKNGFMLGQHWIVVADDFWRNRCMETGAVIWARWRQDTKFGTEFPDIGGRCTRPRFGKGRNKDKFIQAPTTMLNAVPKDE